MASQSVGRPNALAGVQGEMIGEFFGTMVLVLFGDGCVATFGLFNPLGLRTHTSPFIIFGWGFAVMLGIYVAVAISGSHINPPVTLAFAATARHPWSHSLPSWLVPMRVCFL